MLTIVKLYKYQSLLFYTLIVDVKHCVYSSAVLKSFHYLPVGQIFVKKNKLYDI